MLENNRSIGGAGLEQGGPNLGNDITRKDLSLKNAGDALTSPTSMGAGPGDKNSDDEDLPADDELEVDDNDVLADDELEEEFDDEDEDETEEDKTL